MIQESDIIEAGKFLKPHGLKGELNAVCDYDADILAHGYPIIVDIDGIYVPFYAESVRTKGHFSSLVKLEGLDTEEAVRPFVNRLFYLRRADVAEYIGVDADELMTEEDYVGYKVFDKTRGYLGIVEDLDTSTENILLLVRPEEEDADLIYIPFDDDFIEYVEQPSDDSDEEAGEIHMILPEGLLDLNI